MEESDLVKRKHPRLKEFDYGSSGGYFITICAQNRKQVFSKIARKNDNDIVGRGLAPAALVEKTSIGQIVENELKNTEKRFPNIRISESIIMPNHIHLVLLVEGETAGASPRPTVMDFVCAFKSLATKECKKNGYNAKIFQTSFYDRIIRNNDEYMEICNYIRLNPDNWENDELYN